MAESRAERSVKAKRNLPSDPDFLVGYLDTLAETDSEGSDFEGYLSEDDSFSESPLRRASSLESLDMRTPERELELEPEAMCSEREFPLPRSSASSPASQMDGQLASGSPLGKPSSSSPPCSPPSSSSSPAVARRPNIFEPPTFTGVPGITKSGMEKASPIEFFRLFFNEAVMGLIVEETNRFAEQYLEDKQQHLQEHPHARAHDWHRIRLNMKEVDAFLALTIAMGVCGFPSLRCYWSQNWPFWNCNFSAIMSSRRFELLLRFLHLNDSRRQPARGEEGYDKLYKIRPFLNLLIEKFKSSYTPTRCISVDESMVSFKGRLSFLQYMPNKPHKWGIKAWVLADSSNGYTWGWRLYAGKEEGRGELGLAHGVVLGLVEDERLCGKGYVVYMDNFYSSPGLFKDLVARGFGAVGTVRQTRRGIPQTVRDARLRKGEVAHSRDDGVLTLKWKDKREVTMLSTFHSSSMVTITRRSRRALGGVEEVEKPSVVDDYNRHMGGVDLSDQLVLYYGFAHKSVKWWKRVFFHLLDLALVNAHILHRETTKIKITQLDFRLAVAKDLLEGYEHHTRPRSVMLDPRLPNRLGERPFPEPIPGGKKADCEVCSDRSVGERHKTRYRCKVCKVPLHYYPCLEQFHTLKDYKKKYSHRK